MDHDLIIVGGGLAGGLLAYRLRTLRPDLRFVLLEGGPSAGGNHTWSFHATDLSAAEQAWLEPFVVHRWAGYDVAFPARTRRFSSGYRSVTSDRFRAVLAATLGEALRCGVQVEAVERNRVRLAGGEILAARAVIDARGQRPSPHLVLGWQKFLGREVRLAQPHGLAAPTIMDATVAQHDGYRFVYLLPFSSDTLLIEDTYYADAAELPLEALRARIDEYAAARGWTIAEVLREERGVLPIVLDGRAEAFWAEPPDAPARIGLAAALFHPTTGYSLPDAVRTADLIAALPALATAPIAAAVRAHALRQWRRQRFFRMLNRMLFGACAPPGRRAVLQRFHGLPAALIERFYAGRLTLADRLRIVTGKPPVPFFDGLRAAARRLA